MAEIVQDMDVGDNKNHNEKKERRATFKGVL